MNPHLSHEKYASRSSSLNYILIGAILLRSCTWDGVKSSKQLCHHCDGQSSRVGRAHHCDTAHVYSLHKDVGPKEIESSSQHVTKIYIPGTWVTQKSPGVSTFHLR